MTTLGIFCNTFFSEPNLNNFRFPREKVGDSIEVNLILSADVQKNDIEVKSEQYNALNWVWIKDGLCMDVTVHRKLHSTYDWIMFVDTQDVFYLDVLLNNVMPLLKGSGWQITHCFPSQATDCFGDIKHLAERKFPANLYSWTRTDYPLNHFIFSREYLMTLNGRIAPNRIQIHSFYSSLLLNKTKLINHHYPVGKYQVENEEKIFERGLWLLKKEMNYKISGYSSLTKEALGFPVPHRLNRKLMFV